MFYIFYFFLLTFNLSFSYAQDSLNVKWLGSCLGTQSMNIAYCEIDGNSYLCVSQRGSILILDVSDPANPQKIIEIGHPGLIGKTVVVDTILYVANGYYGLWIHNIADPYAPVRLGTCKTDSASAVTVSGNYAYVADGDSGIVIIDVSQPSMPVKISSLYLQSKCVDIAVADTFAYIATHGSLQIINVADPFTPTMVGIWNSHHPSDDVGAVAVQGNFVFLANHWLGFWIVDVTNPQNPVSADSLFFGSALDITVDGNYAYGAAYSNGAAIINITDPYNVYLEGSLDTPGQSKGVDGCSDYVYIADRYSTRIINVIDPANPVLIGVYTNLDAFASDVAISGNYAYVTYRSRGLRIVDISNPYFPDEVSFWDTPGTARGVAVSDSYAYVADYDSGLRIVDITDPFLPYEVSWYSNSGLNVYYVTVSDDYAYLACGDFSGLKILDISNPYSPVLVSSLPTTGGIRIVKQGKYVYVGRSIIDVSNPYAPFEIGRLSSYSDISGIAVSDDYLYTLSPFSVFDVSDHSSPVLLSSLDIGGYDIALQDNYAFIGSNDDAAIRVIDIANPFNLVMEGYYFFDLSGWLGPSGRLDVSDYNIYLAYFYYGLQIFRFTGAPGIEEVRSKKQEARLKVYPNPFRQVTTIKFQIPSSKNQVTMSIYNVSGRLIRQWDYPTIRLSNQIIWNGVDNTGKKLPSGVYFCRLDIGEFSETQKILLLK